MSAETETETETAKRVLRASHLEVLGRTDADEARRVGVVAARTLATDARWRAAPRIGLFASTAGEPSTKPIFEAALAAGREVWLPRCPTRDTMQFAPVRAWDELRRGRYGLLEPTRDAGATPWAANDLVIVPGVAFDRRGGRLGRGGGHYDRHFEGGTSGAPWLLGLGFVFQVVADVPMAEHDRRLDGVLAGGELVWCDSVPAGGGRSSGDRA